MFTESQLQLSVSSGTIENIYVLLSEHVWNISASKPDENYSHPPHRNPVGRPNQRAFRTEEENPRNVATIWAEGFILWLLFILCKYNKHLQTEYMEFEHWLVEEIVRQF